VRKLIALMAAMFVAVPALAQEAVVAAPDTGSVFWNVISYVLGIALVPLTALLGKLILEWQAKLAAEKGQAELGFKEKLKYEVEVTLARIAENIANKELVAIKAAADDGKVTKDELKALGKTAVDLAKAEFKTQGIDIAKKLGQEFLESKLRNIVDKKVNDTPAADVVE